MARKGSTASAADATEGQTEGQDTGSETTQETNDQATQDGGTDTETVENPQAPEHPESGEGNQAGSATGEQTELGAEEGKSDQGAVTSEGEGATTTHIEAVQRSGDLSGAEGDIPVGSTGTRNPDPELANNLGQNEKTAARTEQEVEDRQTGASRRTTRKAMNDKDTLEDLNSELRDAEQEVANAVERRDALRTQHDRLTERMASANATPFGDITSAYFAASDKDAQQAAEDRRKLQASGLGALLGRTV